MKTIYRNTFLLLLALGFAASAIAAKPNQLSKAETKAGFKLLFDGKSFDGWENDGNWVIEDGVITRQKKGGYLSYSAETMPDDFELRFDWKVGDKSNSGLYYRPGQYEYQILDNTKHADGANPRTSAASLYFCMPPSHDNTKPVGEWNTGRIICKGTIIQHWLNGEKVLGFDYSDPRYAWEVELLGKRGAEMDARGRNLQLQDHGDPVWYRNIKLRALSDADKLDRTPITPATIPEEVLALEQKKIEGIIAKRNRSK